MEIQDILSRCDHTLLRTDCTAQEIRTLCDQGIRYGVASVCIPPAHVAGAKRYVGDKLRLCTVIGFPNGYATTRVKAFEADDAIRNGADEIDMVVNLGMVNLLMVNPVILSKSGKYETMEGCLSLSGERKAIRYREIEVEYQDKDMKKHTQKFNGWISEIIQHEMDHLEGIII